MLSWRVACVLRSGDDLFAVARKWVRSVRATSLLLLWLISGSAMAVIQVTDNTGAEVQLAQPAKRIVSLSPHGVELLFAAGAGNRVVGVVNYSDFPPQAQTLPQVGSYNAIDIERVVALRPDLVMAWRSGNGPQAIEQLKRLGLTVYQSESEDLKAIPQTLENIGMLAGTQPVANQASARFRDEVARLQQNYRQRRPVTVFYQLWNQPLYTVGGKQIITELIELCGGRNIFTNLTTLAPVVSLEAVLQADPEVIVASGMAAKRPAWLDDWRRWGTLRAVRNQQLHFIPADLINRPATRILQGAERLCRLIDGARQQQTAPRQGKS